LYSCTVTALDALLWHSLSLRRGSASQLPRVITSGWIAHRCLTAHASSAILWPSEDCFLCLPGSSMSAAGGRPCVFLDIDIGDWRAAYGRCVEFVAANNLKYSLSSDDLEQLGE
jgi:hypothetical protein